MCDCITKVKKDFLDQYFGYKFMRIHLCDLSNSEDTEDSDKKTGQKITTGYEYKKKNGEIGIKKESSFITHTFCPFCGVKYK